MNKITFISVKNLVEDNPYITENTIRNFILNASRNGLGEGLFKIGRRIFIDQDFFYDWLKSHKMKKNKKIENEKKDI